MGAKVLLASATPSMTSYYKFDVVKLEKPYIETNKRYKFITGDSICRPILTMLDKNFKDKEQSLLFYRREEILSIFTVKTVGRHIVVPTVLLVWRYTDKDDI